MDENIFLSYRALDGLSWNGREGVRRREVQFKEGWNSEYMYIVPSRKGENPRKNRLDADGENVLTRI